MERSIRYAIANAKSLEALEEQSDGTLNFQAEITGANLADRALYQVLEETAIQTIGTPTGISPNEGPISNNQLFVPIVLR